MANDPDNILSIVVPMSNEEDGIDAFFARVEPVAEAVFAPLTAFRERSRNLPLIGSR